MDDYNRKRRRSSDTDTTDGVVSDDNHSQQTHQHQQPHRDYKERQGPRFFGHTTTSAQVWTANPDPSFWTDVPSSVTVCQRCYGFGYMARCQGRILDSNDMGVLTSEPSLGQQGQARSNNSLAALGHKRNRLEYYPMHENSAGG